MYVLCMYFILKKTHILLSSTLCRPHKLEIGLVLSNIFEIEIILLVQCDDICMNSRLKKRIHFFSCLFHQAEARAEFAERSVQKLQKEVDRLEGIYFCFLFIIMIFNLESDPKRKRPEFVFIENHEFTY